MVKKIKTISCIFYHNKHSQRDNNWCFPHVLQISQMTHVQSPMYSLPHRLLPWADDPHPQWVKPAVSSPSSSSSSLQPRPLRHWVLLAPLHKHLSSLHHVFIPTAHRLSSGLVTGWQDNCNSHLRVTCFRGHLPHSNCPPDSCQRDPSQRQMQSCHTPAWNSSKAPNDGLAQGSANFFWKGPDSEYFRFYVHLSYEDHST